MTEPAVEPIQILKRQLRRQAQASRHAQADKERLSQAIWQRVFSLPEYAGARTVLAYLNLPHEVHTQPFLPLLEQQGKRVAIPFCQAEGLRLFAMESLAEFEPGTLGILEPKADLRDRPGKRLAIAQIDLVIVPGVAFDRRGGRLGHGKGYYDRLLAGARRDTCLVGVGFECQLLPEIPMLPYDIFMDRVVTEAAVYP